MILSALLDTLLGGNVTSYWESAQWLAFTPLLLLFAWLSFRKATGTATRRELPKAKRLWTDADGVSAKPPLLRGRKSRGVLFTSGILLALLALCRPQWGEIEEVTFDQQREIILGLDLSQSMLAEDIVPSRLERSKLLIGALLDQLKGERVGLAVFAGTSFLQSPLSSDHEVLRDLLVDLDPSFLPQSGTRYEALLQTALEAFSQEGDADRFLIILSDGESHEENWRALLPKLRERDIHVLGLGVGTAEGGLVPSPTGGLLKDARGAAVLSRLQPSTLQALAKGTNGEYREASVWVDIAELIEHSVAQGTKGDFVDKRQSKLHDRFQLFLAPALFFLFLSYLWEFPVTAKARRLQVGPTPKAPETTEGSTGNRRPSFFNESRPTSSNLLFWLTLLSLPFFSSQPLAQTSPEVIQPPSSLEALVGQLALSENLSAEDYGNLAQETLTYASQPPQEAQDSILGVIEDGLSAVDRGKRLDGEAMPWDELRSALLQLQQREEQKQEQQEQQESSGENGDESQEQNQEQEGGEQESQGDSQDSQQRGEQDGEPQEGDSSGDPSDSGEEQGDDSESQSASNQEGEEEPQAKQSEQASLSEVGADDSEEEPEEDSEPETQEETRMVGGQPQSLDEFAADNPELASTLGKLERVRDRDAPALLFERMRDQEGQGKRPPKNEGKNW